MHYTPVLELYQLETWVGVQQSDVDCLNQDY